MRHPCICDAQLPSTGCVTRMRRHTLGALGPPQLTLVQSCTPQVSRGAPAEHLVRETSMATQVTTCLVVLPSSRGKGVRVSRRAAVLPSSARPAPSTVAGRPKKASTRLHRMKVRTQEGARGCRATHGGDSPRCPLLWPGGVLFCPLQEAVALRAGAVQKLRQWADVGGRIRGAAHCHDGAFVATTRELAITASSL